jgi:hypothetical protein
MTRVPMVVILGFLLLCGCVATPDRPLETALGFATPSAGNLMILARRGVSFSDPLNYDYRICNTGPAFDLNVYWNLHDASVPSTPPTQLQALPSGSCIDLGGATSIQLQNGATQTTGLSGYVARYRTGTFAQGFRIGPVPAGGQTPLPPGTPAAGGKEWVVGCLPIGDRSQSAGQSFTQKCPIPLPVPGSYRLCFDDKFIDRRDGGTVWPPSLVPTIVDRDLLGITVPSDDGYNSKWNPVLEKSCRDYYGIREVYALIGGDANYDANNVIAVHVNVAPLR